MDADFRVFRGFIGAVDAGEVLDLACFRLGIKPFRIALLALLDRRVDKDFNELALAHQIPCHLPLRPERRDEGAKHDQTRIGHKPGHFRHPADVLHPVGVGKAEIPV
ncbi:hypothetical protein LAX5112_05032 [Roseibium alexandrii]|uniref:Uncharacterized protein n=1 Tax=Roseibium alexandrii TaxID=388408 RepID=A0A0M7AS53_9HYPH|nr:hypothetical protein LAX5112_05032 [Roseibium alexandrii]